MTATKQPEALELASVAESADLVGYPTAKKANAYYLCLLEDCAQMIRKLQAENQSLLAERERNLASIRVNSEIVNRKNTELETLALYKSLADEYGLSIFPDIAEMTAELETLRAKLKTYEDLGGAGSDVQLLRMGYAAARLEIESLKSQSAAQRSGAAYAALSDAEIDRIVPALEPVSEDFPVEWALWKDRGRIRNELRTSHGQAPAQAAPADTEVLDVLRAFAEGRINHINEGLCPDSIAGPNSRDPDCRVCRALDGAAPAAVAPDGDYDALRCAVGNCTFNGEVTQHAATCQNKPAAQAAHQQEPTCKENLQVQVWVIPNGAGSGQFSWEPQDERYWTKLTTQPAPQQEAQEPAAVVVPCHTPSGKRVALYSAKQDLPIGTQLYTAPQPSPAAQGDALPREDFAWLVVQEACETEPADEDDPECVRILRRDLKSSVLAAFLRLDAARAAQEGKSHDN